MKQKQATLPAKDYKYIGFIIVQFSAIENIFDYLIWDILKLDDHTGRILSASTPYEAKKNILLGLAKIKFKDKKTFLEFKKLITQADKAFKRRSYFAHGIWFYDTKKKTSSVTLRNKNKDEVNYKSVQYTDKNFTEFRFISVHA